MNVNEAAANVINHASRPNGLRSGAVTCQVPIILLRKLQEAMAGCEDSDLAPINHALARKWK